MKRIIEDIFEAIDSSDTDELVKIGLEVARCDYCQVNGHPIKEYWVDVFRTIPRSDSHRFRFTIKCDFGGKRMLRENWIVTWVGTFDEYRINEVHGKIIPILRDRRLNELGVC